jgi:membrane protein
MALRPAKACRVDAEIAEVMADENVVPDRTRRVRELARTLIQEAGNDRVLGLAAEIAFFAVLSLFPGLLIAASLLSFLDVLVGADVAIETQARVTSALDLILTDRASRTVESVEAVFEGQYGGLLTFATVGALVTLSGAWTVVIDALNLAYDVRERRSWVRRRLLGLGLGLATVTVLSLALAVVVIGPLLGRGEDLAELVGLGSVFVWTWNLLRLPLLFVGITVWLMVVLRHAPNRRTPWRGALPGALATSILWLLATLGFHLYLRVAGDRNPLLGVFGGGVIVMTWVYLLSVALLLGGELNAILHDKRHLSESGRGSSAA